MAAKAVTVTLGDMTAHAERHLAPSRFASMSELVRARVAEALADPRPPVDAAAGFAAVRAAVRRPEA